MATRRPVIRVGGHDRQLSPGDMVSGSGLTKESVSAGDAMVIPPGHQYVVYGAFGVAGTLEIQGKLVLI